MRFSSIVAVLVACVVSSLGCNQAQPPIDRVQPNAIDKSLFDGEWYYLQTVIDAPYETQFTFVGDQSSLEKIRWDIQENYLVARRSYQWIAGSQDPGISGRSDAQGAPVGMWKIESHFDIRRQYNPTTGEQLNVVEENTTDRPWYERKYMRVDWSKNLITDTHLFQVARYFDGVTMEPESYYVNDPSDPDAPKFDKDPTTGQVNYIDIVGKVFAQPTTVNIEGWGPVPTCWLEGNEHLDCSSAEITVRHSFLKVDPKDDYQPFDYTGDRMSQFGYFVSERAGYDPHYGVVDPARYRFSDRHDIWAASHRSDASGQPISCTADSDCDDGRGSVCDMDWAKAHRTDHGLCTIAYRDRTVRPIAYHVSDNLPEDLFPDAQFLVDGWSGALHDTVASLRENECLAHGSGAGQCSDERNRPDAAHPFVLCHNPVADGDPEACGASGTVARIGDLRYNLIGWVSDPGLGNPLGYGPSAADPETGRIVQANAFIYGADVEWYATYARDLIAMLNGDLSEADLTSGAAVDAWVQNMQAPGSALRHVVDVTGADASRIDQAMDFRWARPGAGPGRSRGKPRSFAEMRSRFHAAEARIAQAGGYGTGDGSGAARLAALHGTPLERALVGAEARVAAGIDPHQPVDDSVLAAASPLSGHSLAHERALARARQKLRSEPCMLGQDFADDGLLGLARAVQKAVRDGSGTMDWYGKTYSVLGPDGHIDYEAVRTMLRHPIFEATTAHEVGHTLGLRHNFSGSYDSVNYHHQYWQLRDDGNMQPRAWDPMTQAEIDGREREYQTSTVMDYGNNFVVTDAAGVGHYDRAAIKMGYGDLVEVFTNAHDTHDVAEWNALQQEGWEVHLKESSFLNGYPISAYTYTDFPGLVGGINHLEQRADVPYTSLRPEPMLAANGFTANVVDAQGRPAVPYRFCSDEQVNLDPSCMTYDAGADPYESLQSIIDSYWNYYPLAAFRRGRIGFNPSDYYWRVANRYFAKLQEANQLYALNRSFYEDAWAGDPSLADFWTREDGYGAWTLGVGESYALLTRVLATPAPGGYSHTTRPDGTDALGTDFYSSSPDANVSFDDGRALETTWDFSQGYYWFDQIARAGFFIDKALAIQVLTDPTTYFIGRDTSADVRQYELSFYSTFGPSLTGLMRGLLSEDWNTFAPRVGTDGNLVYPDPLQLAQGDMPGAPVDPDASFSLALYGAVFGMALVPETYDLDYLNRARIWAQGSAEAIDPAPGTPLVSYTDPRSGLVYQAVSYPDGSGTETGVGAQMIDHALSLDAAGPDGQAALPRYVDQLDMVRSLSWYLGFGP